MIEKLDNASQSYRDIVTCFGGTFIWRFKNSDVSGYPSTIHHVTTRERDMNGPFTHAPILIHVYLIDPGAQNKMFL